MLKFLYYNEKNQIKSIENLFYKKHGEVKSFYRNFNLKKIGYFF